MKPSTPRPDSARPDQGPTQGPNVAAPRVVSLLTDYGLADGFVGAIHSVLRARLPLVPIVDLTHAVRPQDVRAGSLALKRAAPYLAEGVVVAIVDPGVGTRRRPIAVRAASAGVTFVGPDNGLMPPALDALGGPDMAVQLDNPAYRLAAPGPTFAGRDIFAPAAAYLASGGDLETLGHHVDVETLVRLPPPQCWESGGSLAMEVTWVDHYGNVQLGAGPEALHGGSNLSVSKAGRAPAGVGRPPRPDHPVGPGTSWPARVVHTFADLDPGELGVLVDSYGSLALCLNGASAAELLGTVEQEILWLRPAEPR